MINIKDKNCLLNISESIEKIEAYTTNIEPTNNFMHIRLSLMLF